MRSAPQIEKKNVQKNSGKSQTGEFLTFLASKGLKRVFND